MNFVAKIRLFPTARSVLASAAVTGLLLATALPVAADDLSGQVITRPRNDSVVSAPPADGGVILEHPDLVVYELWIDSDLDRISDDHEVGRYGTDPGLWDTDEDGRSDYDELFVYDTSPLIPDVSAAPAEPLLDDSDPGEDEDEDETGGDGGWGGEYDCKDPELLTGYFGQDSGLCDNRTEPAFDNYD